MAKPFSVVLNADQIKVGLRKSSRSPRNTGAMAECAGMVGNNGVLAAVAELTQLDTSFITEEFPFPQFFVLTNLIIVCDSKHIYEWNGSSFVLKYTATNSNGLWAIGDYYEFLYLSNGIDSVTRDPVTKAYEVSTTLPTFSAICNFNGQTIIGNPDTGASYLTFCAYDGNFSLVIDISAGLEIWLGYLETEDDVDLETEDSVKFDIYSFVNC